MTRMLWTHNPERVGAHVLRRPSLLLSAATPDALAAWYDRHPWALSLPLVLWHRDPVDTVALRVFDVAARERGDDGHACHRYVTDGPGPCCVTAPAALLRAADLGFVEVDADDPRRIRAAVLTARAVASAARASLAWEVCAEATGGALAVGAALAAGSSVAVSHETPPALTTAIADAHGVAFRAWLDREERARIIDA